MKHQSGINDVSVIVPAHNRELSIANCIRSVLQQTFPPSEVLVIDDASTDRTADVVLDTVDPRVRLLRFEVNRGAQAARNLGIREAKYEWIAFLDSDDQWQPGLLEAYRKRSAETGRDVIYGTGIRKTDSKQAAIDMPDLEQEGYRILLSRPGPMFQGLLVKRSRLLEIGGLDERVPAFQEWDTAIRLAAVTDFAFQPDPLFVYNIHDGPRISADLQLDAKGVEYIFQKHAAAMMRIGGRETLEYRRADVARRFRRAGMVPDWRKHQLRWLYHQDLNTFDKCVGMLCTAVFPRQSMAAEARGGAALRVRARLAEMRNRIMRWQGEQ